VLKDTTGSTNDDARTLIAQGAPHGTLVVADVQTQGRGRRGRVWQSLPGQDLAVSLILRPTLAVTDAPLLALVTGLAVAEALEAFVPPSLRPTVKWPNDVRLGGRKVAGVLVEGSLREGGLAWAVAGVGINVRSGAPPESLAAIATTLRMARDGADLPRDAVLNAVCLHWERRLEGLFRDGFGSFATALRDRCDTLGQRVSAEGVSGVAEAIADDGGLVLRTDEGARVVVRAGDLTEA